jgi:SAM-dependent methyltransferase
MLQARSLKEYSLQAFRAEFVQSRPDLQDVRNYNWQMVDILFGIRDLTGQTLLDIGASPHGFAMERALEKGVQEYCGIGLGVPVDTLVRDGARTGVLLGMNAEQLEIASSAFDAIISLSTFEHFFHPEAVLVEMYRVLKPGGVVLASFQPVWTSIRGHHLHHIPDVCGLLPPWAHLRWTRQELIANLATSWPATASMSLADVARWIYESDEINRIDASVLRRVLESSPLAVEWITPLKDELSEAELVEARRLAATGRYPIEELTIKGFSALLVKRA